ncbi:MAG: LTA synthase family protein [Planctomycetota bacterium]|nr:LTA synthase family protein [Planctomycetota bacterium]
MEQIAYHLIFPLTGVDRAYYFSFARNFSVGIFAAIAYGILLHRALAGKSTCRIQPHVMRRALVVLVVCVAGFSIGYMEYRYGAAAFIKRSFSFGDVASTYFADEYRPVHPEDVVFPHGRNNLVLLILESTESTANREGAPEEKLTPELDRIARENISFSRHMQTFGTDWSMAGLTSFVTGVPLIIPGMKQAASGDLTDDFLPNLPTLLEILEAHGYGIEFLQGGNALFADQEKLFTTHSKRASIKDLRYFKDKLAGKPEYIDGWGVHDEEVFAEARECLVKNSGKEEGYALIFLTIDTHGEYAESPRLERRWGDVRDNFLRLDRQAASFMEWLGKQDFAEQTTVVLLGDHLFRKAEMGPVALPPPEKRGIYNAIVNSRARPELPTEGRRFASWDFAPTILESIGGVFPERRMGIGVSLFSKAPTLLESYGFETHEREIAAYSELYMSFYAAGFAKKLTRK